MKKKKKRHKKEYCFENKETELVRGLLRCKSVKHECEVCHNRDKNAVLNMLNIVQSIFDTGKRSDVFSRTDIN